MNELHVFIPRENWSRWYSNTIRLLASKLLPYDFLTLDLTRLEAFLNKLMLRPHGTVIDLKGVCGEIDYTATIIVIDPNIHREEFDMDKI